MGRSDLTLKPLLWLSALAVAGMLGGCGQMAGMSGLPLLGGSEQQTAEASPAPADPPAALPPKQMPPLPAHRPGKRPRVAAAKQPAQAKPEAADPPAEPAKPAESEGSGLSLTGLTDIHLFSSAPDAGGPDRVLIDKSPVDAYSLLAQRIKYCWLNPTTPRLPNHGFYSDLAAGDVKEAKMIVYEKDPDGRRGTSVFKIDITADSSGSLVAAQNVKLDKRLEANFKADLARWAKGDERCKS